jgi:sialic acid synthase SpsE
MKIMNQILKRTFIIAEIGKNFIQTEEDRSVEEYLDNAKELVLRAKEAGADAVKFQTHYVHDEILNIKFTSPHFTEKGSDRYSWVSRNTHATPFLEFWKPLKKFCDEQNIMFMSTPMSLGAAKRLNELSPKLWKVGSGDMLDFVTLDYLTKTKKPIIFSSGMSTLEETEKTINFLKSKGALPILLHCVSKYPCPPEELNLNTIKFYNEKFNIPIGFSDHSLENNAAVAAVALGAKVIEKHFTLSRNLYGADHKVSQTPTEFKQLVSRIREIESNSKKQREILSSELTKKSLGTTEKILNNDEAVFRPLFRKSLMAGQNITAGTILTKEMIYAMRPQQHAGGLPSEEFLNIIGKTTKVSLKRFDPITSEVIQ